MFHSSKVEFICLFFGRNVGLKKSFRLCLTFRNKAWTVHYKPRMYLKNFLVYYVHNLSLILTAVKNGIKHVQTAAYYGARTVHTLSFFFSVMLQSIFLYIHIPSKRPWHFQQYVISSTFYFLKASLFFHLINNA